MEDDLPASKALIEKASDEDEEAVINRSILFTKIIRNFFNFWLKKSDF